MSFLIGFAILLPGLLLLLGLAYCISRVMLGEPDLMEGLLVILLLIGVGILCWGAVDACIAVGEAVR